MPPRAVLLDLLMATMNSIDAWSEAAGDRALGLAWRDAVTARMIEAGAYVPYERLVGAAAADLGLGDSAPAALRDAWGRMQPWPDSVALERPALPYAFVTNCSAELAELAAGRSGLRPAFVLSAEEADWYKPRPEIYRLACARLQAGAADVRFVAGAPYDALGARDAGIEATLVARRPVDEDLPPGITIVSSLHEALAGI
jgi:HAD superfamily hydrolase (TIGR01493 family)